MVNTINSRPPNGESIFVHFKLSSLSFSWEMGQLGKQRGLIFCTDLYFSTLTYTCQDINYALMLRQRKHHFSVSQMGSSKAWCVRKSLFSSYNNIKNRTGSGFSRERALGNEWIILCLTNKWVFPCWVGDLLPLQPLTNGTLFGFYRHTCPQRHTYEQTCAVERVRFGVRKPKILIFGSSTY